MWGVNTVTIQLSSLKQISCIEMVLTHIQCSQRWKCGHITAGRFYQCWSQFASWEIITVYCSVPASAQNEPSGSTSPTGVFPSLFELFSLHWKLAAWLLFAFVGFLQGGSIGWTEITVILNICPDFGWGAGVPSSHYFLNTLILLNC